MGGQGYAMETGSPTSYSTLDYNGYRRNATEQFLKWIDANRNVGRYQSVAELHSATDLEEHGLEVDYDVFVGAGPPVEGSKSYAPADYDLRLQPGTTSIDVGIQIPQVTDDSRGTAPDLGCYELGQDVPHYGPRRLGDRVALK